jgi:hypothetical protein
MGSALIAFSVLKSEKYTNKEATSELNLAEVTQPLSNEVAEGKN